MQRDLNGLEVLDPSECMRLLGSVSLGRIGLSSDALPVVLPVNFVLVGDQIVVRTRRGTKLAAATRNAIVAFEVDQLDPHSGVGWSVMVQGFARELADPDELAAANAAPLARWIDRHDGRHVGISIDVISGRRVEADGPLPAEGEAVVGP